MMFDLADVHVYIHSHNLSGCNIFTAEELPCIRKVSVREIVFSVVCLVITQLFTFTLKHKGLNCFGTQGVKLLWNTRG